MTDKFIDPMVAWAYQSAWMDGDIGEMARTIVSLNDLLTNQPEKPHTELRGVELAVPYSSQHERDATKFRLDCGPTCVEMVGECFNRDVQWSTDHIMEYITNGAERGTYGHELVTALKELYQVGAERKTTDFAQLLVEIDNGHPAIILVKYGKFPMRMDRNYTGGHWMVVMGYRTYLWGRDIVTQLLIHDPDWYSGLMGQGAALPVVEQMFDEMYSGVSVVAYRRY